MTRIGQRLIALNFGAALALGYTQSAHAAVVNVQVINVCDDNGQNCALSSPYANTGYNPAATQRIFGQAGITVNFLDPIKFNSTAYLNPAILDDPSHGYLFGSPTDPAHQLMNLPNHGQNLDRNVLDLWLVNTLPHNPGASGASTAAQPFGIGLTNANGAVVTTGDNGSGYIAGLDNIAHELAHNLGLTHVEDAPLAGTTVAAGPAATPPAPPGTYANAVPVDTSANLLRSIGRLVPRDPCAIATPTCANVDPPAGKDQLLPFQQAALQTSAQNLFSVSGLTATAKFDQRLISNCTALSQNCDFTLDLKSPDPSKGSLIGFKVRFLYNVGSFSGVNVYSNFFNDCALTFSNAAPLPDGGSELAFSLGAGCSSTGVENRVVLPGSAPGQYVPFSFEFDFSGGLTSRAAFDSSGVASSTTPFYISRTDVPAGSVGLDVPTDPAMFNAISNAEFTAASPRDIPEPPTTLLFGLALVGTLFSARRPSGRNRRPATAR